MRCVLIIPSWSPEDIFPTKTAISQLNYWQPLGTLYVAAAIRQAGHKVLFTNGAFLSTDEIILQTAGFCPDLIGIYATTFGWRRAAALARQLREKLPLPHITVGGPYPTAVGEQCLRDEARIDSVVMGEGEETVVDLLDRLQHGATLAGCLGLIFRSADTVVSNQPRPFMKNLDLLPLPARDLLGDRDRYLPPPATYRRKPVAVVITSRGCNRHCIYCSQMDRHRASGIRYRSIGKVIEEIEELLHQGYREIKFIDDTLAADPERAHLLCDEILRRKLNFSWFASACVNQVDPLLFRKFKKAGCWAVLMGAESGVQKNLNTLKKGTTIGQIRRAVADAKAAGLAVFTPFLIGIPGETREEALATIDFACSLDPDMANFHALTPFPGTELYDNIERYGRLADNLEDYTYQGAAFIPHTMRRDEIQELRQLAFRRFFSRPRFLVRRCLAIRSLADVRASYRGLRSLFWLWMRSRLFRCRPHRHGAEKTSTKAPASPAAQQGRSACGSTHGCTDNAAR